MVAVTWRVAHDFYDVSVAGVVGNGKSGSSRCSGGGRESSEVASTGVDDDR